MLQQAPRELKMETHSSSDYLIHFKPYLQKHAYI